MITSFSRPLGRVDQIGIVVDDAEQAAAHWSTKCGVGPFFVLERFVYPEWRFEGVKTDAVILTMAFSYIGDLQIELIQQHSDQPTVYTAFRKTSNTGLVHLAVFADDIWEASEPLRARGAKEIQWGRDAAGGECLYLDTAFHNGGYIEFISSNAARNARRTRIKEAARSWDGTAPYRPMESIT